MSNAKVKRGWTSFRGERVPYVEFSDPTPKPLYHRSAVLQQLADLRLGGKPLTLDYSGRKTPFAKWISTQRIRLNRPLLTWNRTNRPNVYEIRLKGGLQKFRPLKAAATQYEAKRIIAQATASELGRRAMSLSPRGSR